MLCCTPQNFSYHAQIMLNIITVPRFPCFANKFAALNIETQTIIPCLLNGCHRKGQQTLTEQSAP